MDEHRRIAALKTSQIFLVAILAFNLGQHSVQFSGSGWAWTALVLNLIGLPLILFLLIYDFWKAKA